MMRQATSRGWLGGAAIALALTGCGMGDSEKNGDVDGKSTLATLNSTQITAALNAVDSSGGLALAATAPKCDVKMVSMTYVSEMPDQSKVKVSGVVLLPQQPTGATSCPTGARPLLAYTPGTEVIKSRTLASTSAGETVLMAGIYAAQGYAVVLTDNLGYGTGNASYHPYLHASTEAQTLIDAIKAARTIASGESVSLNKLFVAGYSQGGHSAMAAVQALENQGSDFVINASAPMSGPYALEDTFVQGLAASTTGSGATVFGTFALTSYQKVYGNLWTAATDVFKAPYATGIESLLPGTLTFTQLYTTGKLPVNNPDLFTTAFISGYTTNANHPARLATRANSFVGTFVSSTWKPAKPMLLCGGSRDPVVPFANSQAASSVFLGRGATVSLLDIDSQVPSALPLDQYHGYAMVPCALAARTFFAQF